jgi:hypothetical protein
MRAIGARFVALLVTIVLAGVVMSQPAQATCVGGTNLRGSFGVVISGPAAGGGVEYYAGILTSNAKCALSGTLIGGVSGAPVSTSTVAGTYSLPGSGQNTMTLLLGGSQTEFTFAVGTVSTGKELFGIQSDGAATATIDLSQIARSTYTDASLSGNYVQLCSGTFDNGQNVAYDELDFFTFDGAGDWTAVLQSGGTASGKYNVSSNGTVSTTETSPNNKIVEAWALVDRPAEARGIVYYAPPSQVGPYGTCTLKQQ